MADRAPTCSSPIPSSGILSSLNNVSLLGQYGENGGLSSEGRSRKGLWFDVGPAKTAVCLMSVVFKCDFNQVSSFIFTTVIIIAMQICVPHYGSAEQCSAGGQ